MPHRWRPLAFVRALSPDGRPGCLRPAAEIELQYVAAQSFASSASGLELEDHRYSAGQAATIAWLRGRSSHPLPGKSTSRWRLTPYGRVERAGSLQAPQLREVRELERRLRRSPAGEPTGDRGADPGGPLLVSPEYALGIAHACQWALQMSAAEPFGELPANGTGR